MILIGAQDRHVVLVCTAKRQDTYAGVAPYHEHLADTVALEKIRDEVSGVLSDGISCGYHDVGKWGGKGMIGVQGRSKDGTDLTTNDRL